MSKQPKQTSIARQVELFIRQLDSLSILPQVAAGFLSCHSGKETNRATMHEIIESDAALTTCVFSLAHREGIVCAGQKQGLSDVLEKLPISVIRDAVLSVKVLQALEVGSGQDQDSVLPRKQLDLHALATACCAAEIAEIALGPDNRQIAFSAGLLHDIGKLAINEVMPKSFERIASEAKEQSASFADIERKHLGVDHAILGKRLGEKWHLPEETVLAIWLHHADIATISDNLPGARIAQVVAAGDIIARQCGIGLSGSCDQPDMLDELIKSLSLTTEQIEQIRGGLAEQVGCRSELLGLNIPNPGTWYCQQISETAAELSKNNSVLQNDKQQLGTGFAQWEFINNFLADISPDMAASDIAADFAGRWQMHYQTGPVAVYLLNELNDPFIEFTVIDDSGGRNTVIVQCSNDVSIMPEKLSSSFSVVDAKDHLGWIFEQLDFSFNLDKTKMFPLISGGRAIGVLVFEQRIPVDIEKQLPVFSVSASVGSIVIALALSCARGNLLAEKFSEALSCLRQNRKQIEESKLIASIAEMAAGAGHELNNPLAVISGRVQLLSQTEEDADKKQILQQIQDRTEEISTIVSDLMEFAKPRQPQPKIISLRILLDHAVTKAGQSQTVSSIETVFDDNIDKLNDVYVDSDQVSMALAHIISNAVESYGGGGGGPVYITGNCQQSDRYVTFRIADNGCGMDMQTLSKATEPFYSDKPAGRKRGMGLAHAKRLIGLNNGSMSIASQPGQGATVTINLTQAE